MVILIKFLFVLLPSSVVRGPCCSSRSSPTFYPLPSPTFSVVWLLKCRACALFPSAWNKQANGATRTRREVLPHPHSFHMQRLGLPSLGRGKPRGENTRLSRGTPSPPLPDRLTRWRFFFPSPIPPSLDPIRGYPRGQRGYRMRQKPRANLIGRHFSLPSPPLGHNSNS